VSRSRPKSILALLSALAAVVALAVGAPGASAASGLPCDVHADAGTPCVAAYSPSRSLRHCDYNVCDYNVCLASDGGSNDFDSTTSWSDDVSRQVTSPWAP
jgi:hypothetical protein